MAVITVSRHPGSLGDTLARALAERLHYRLVEREELARAAEQIGGPDAAFSRSPELREHSPSFLERLRDERLRYSSMLLWVSTQLAYEGDVVIVGLGAGQFLNGLNNVLRLQVTAPPEVRLERVMRRGFDEVPGPLTHDRARELIRDRDRDSAGYMRYLFNIDWMEPHQWDLVINTGRLSVPKAVELVAAMVESGGLEPSEADRQHLANLVLASHVAVTVLNDPMVCVTGLKVVAQEGQVRIEGEVTTEDERAVAEQVVEAIEGVRQVDNDLLVKPPSLTAMLTAWS